MADELSVQIRNAGPGDEGDIVALIQRLASFERAPQAPVLTEDDVRRDCLGDHPRFRVLLAESDGALVGGVVLIEAYSSWAGAPTLIVHDLFVEEDARARGVGIALLRASARVGLEAGCCRIDVNVRAWNKSAIAFYQALGFQALEGWQPYRLDREGLEVLAAA